MPRFKSLEDFRVPDFSSLEDAELLGFITGDGSVDRKRSRVKACCLIRELDHVIFLFKQVFCLEPVVSHNDLAHGRVRLTPVYDVVIHRKILVKWFESIGFWDGAEKQVPSVIRNANACVKGAYLKGLFEADGCVDYIGVLGLVGSSKRLMEQVHQLLEDLCIHNSVNRNARPDGRVWYQIRVRNGSRAQFLANVGFFTSYKIGRLENACSAMS